MFLIRCFQKEGDKMEKVIKKYGVVILLYLVIVGGILLLNERFRLLNHRDSLISEVAK